MNSYRIIIFNYGGYNLAKPFKCIYLMAIQMEESCVNFLIGMEEFIKYQEMKFQILLIEKILKILGFIFFWEKMKIIVILFILVKQKKYLQE